ncbi:MAG: type II toxin-antitoxin system RelE/ParE family toxin [Candidatus Thiosymbion ectosymbiont of Robbea hypermnestra]|nr:type II toxin-antitoxin system RelE/ParE family toxin [Candidatus Thiosymbion ectosymbiont of Robbea hypermnestra]
MIGSYRDDETKKLANGGRSRRLPQDIQPRARMRLERLAAAVSLDDLRTPPSHRLEALSGDRRGQYSIRINDQWRLCFEWRDGRAYRVEIVDYH